MHTVTTSAELSLSLGLSVKISRLQCVVLDNKATLVRKLLHVRTRQMHLYSTSSCLTHLIIVFAEVPLVELSYF